MARECHMNRRHRKYLNVAVETRVTDKDVYVSGSKTRKGWERELEN